MTFGNAVNASEKRVFQLACNKLLKRGVLIDTDGDAVVLRHVHSLKKLTKGREDAVNPCFSFHYAGLSSKLVFSVNGKATDAEKYQFRTYAEALTMAEILWDAIFAQLQTRV